MSKQQPRDPMCCIKRLDGISVRGLLDTVDMGEERRGEPARSFKLYISLFLIFLFFSQAWGSGEKGVG